MRKVYLVCPIFTFILCIHGKPIDPLNDIDNAILTNDVQQLYVPPTTPRPKKNSVQQMTQTVEVPNQQSPVETTTEYIYKDLIAPYTVETPKLHSIRHSAGTLYYSVHPKENEYDKLMEVYKDNFETPMNRNLPSNVPPPKY